MEKYIYTQDPSHGWVRVKKEEIKRLEIEKDISCFSYVNNKYVYLEESCDLGVFIKAKKKKGEEFFLKSKNVDKTIIRSFEHYSPLL